tara:strand:- start:68 stop:796 length:729 start_codon:yes stop_codon:yes gene_type:complete
MKLLISSLALFVFAATTAFAGTIDPSQEEHLTNKRYAQCPKPPQQKVNKSAEPKLEKGFVPLFENGSIEGWVPRGGTCTFELIEGELVGTCDPGSDSTYFSSPREDYGDFILTFEFKWDVMGNTGVQFRSFVNEKGSVAGYQCEIDPSDRGWTGGIYNQSLDGWKYPLWMTEHNPVRENLKKDGWNRVTIRAKGNVIETWINGYGATHLENDERSTGLFAFQIHKGKEGKVRWRDLKIKELK